MKPQLQQMYTRILGMASCLALVVLLTACTSGNATPVVKSKPTPKPTVLTLLTYQGDGYSIGYPQNWLAKGKGSFVTFTDAQGLTTFSIEETPNPNALIPPTTAITGGLNGFKGQGTNFQQVDVVPTLTVGGNSWSQGAATADATANGQTTNLKLVVLSSNYPQHAVSTRTFTLIYAAQTKEFEQANTQSFQPMLQSFKFV